MCGGSDLGPLGVTETKDNDHEMLLGLDNSHFGEYNLGERLRTIEKKLVAGLASD